MLEKIDRWTETVAAELCVSRRGFFGRVGQGALVLLGAMAGLFGVPREAFGYPVLTTDVCCEYSCNGGTSFTCLKRKNDEPCPPPPAGCTPYKVIHCQQCRFIAG
jgi:hypothetical protein